MINVAIVDDEKNCVEVLEKLLFECNQNINIVGTANSVESALRLIEENKNDIHILFLDIHIPGGNGFSVIKNLTNIKFQIVFTTAFDQYAINAIRFSALDYILKPINQNELQNTLDRFEVILPQKTAIIENFKEKLIQNKLFDKLAIQTQSEIIFLALNDIIYLESDKNYTTIYLENGNKIVASKNLGYFEEILPTNEFFRTHNFYIVNLSKIKKYIKGKTGALTLNNGAMLEVSPKRKDDLFKFLNL
ncbi:MAG: LytTR family DNA-binding domain-containing protein [Bacteroidia bacterium]|nr:LytTR family DNA-binding domain-containing protein [Bacteroidia bacterium]